MKRTRNSILLQFLSYIKISCYKNVTCYCNMYSNYKHGAWWLNKLWYSLNFRPMNMVFGAHNWNTPKFTPNDHVNQNWCETSETFWENDLTLDYFLSWDPKWPNNQAFDTYVLHISKSSSNEHADQDWCKISGNCLRQWPETRIFLIYFGPKMTRK